MTQEELQDKKRHFKKAMASYRNTGRITECFYHDKTTCNGDVEYIREEK